MPAGETKRRVLEAIEELPSDATVEDAIERLCFLAKVQKGLRLAERCRTKRRRNDCSLAEVIWTD